MKMELITAKKTKVSPQNITDGIYGLINLLSNTDLNIVSIAYIMPRTAKTATIPRRSIIPPNSRASDEFNISLYFSEEIKSMPFIFYPPKSKGKHLAASNDRGVLGSEHQKCGAYSCS